MDLPTPEAAPAADGERRVVVAAIVGAHGIAGEVRLKVFAEDLGAHQVLNGGAFTLRSVRRGNNGAIARFAEIDSRDAAEALRGTPRWVARDSQPPREEGEY
jgi:16S rRNA processing protein RimM